MNFDPDEYDISLIMKYLKEYFDEHAFEPDINPESNIIVDIKNMMDDNKWIMLFKFCESKTFCNHFIDEFFSDYLIEKLKNKKHNDIKQVLEDYNDKFFNILTPEKVNRRLEKFDLFFERVENELNEEDFIEFYKIDKLKNLLNLKNLKLIANLSKDINNMELENEIEYNLRKGRKINIEKVLNKCKKNNYNNDYTKIFILVFFNKFIHNLKEETFYKIRDDLKNMITPKCPVFKDLSRKCLSEKNYNDLCKYEIFKNLMTSEELEEFKHDITIRKKEREKLGLEFVKLFD